MISTFINYKKIFLISNEQNTLENLESKKFITNNNQYKPDPDLRRSPKALNSICVEINMKRK